MTINLTPDIVRNTADRLITRGIQPTAETISQQLGLAEVDSTIDDYLKDWWSGLSGRLLLSLHGAQQAPDAMSRAVKILWQDAVAEASSMMASERLTMDHSVQVLREESEEMLVSSRADYDSLDTRYRREVMRAEELETQIKVLEAEVSVMNSNLSGEITLRKQTEAALQDARNDLKRSAKVLEDAKRTFDVRLKDEQNHGQEQVAKADAELLHYRKSLEMVRDDAGKKESALTKNIHDLQTELAKKEVKIDTLQGQAKNTEAELRSMRADIGSQSRQISQLNAKLLSEINKNKRLEERVKQLDTDLKQEQQRLKSSASDAMRKEAELRQALKGREDELMRSKAALASVQKKMISQEEQIRRLHAQAKV